MMKKRGQGQSWSLDIILAFVIFVLVIGIFYTLLTNRASTSQDRLQLEASTLANNLDSATGLNTTLAVMEQGTIDTQKVIALYNSSYKDIKSKFGIRGEFCIYIVDQDDNLITVVTDKGEMNGFGNGNLTINGLPCGSRMN